MKYKKYFIKNCLYTVGMTLHIPGTRKDMKHRINSINYKNYVLNDFMLDNKGLYVPQGLCIAGKYTLVTAYDSSDLKSNSIVIILDGDKELKRVNIYNNAHVGGITYDDKNNNIWITDKHGTISCYSFDDLFTSDILKPKYKKIDVSSNLRNIYGNNAVAYISYYNNKLFLGNYNLYDESILKIFNIDSEGNIDIESEKDILISNHVQGITFHELDDKSYMLVSSSYGALAKSTLKIYEYNDSISNYRLEPYKEVSMPAMMEQIISSEDKLYTLYESNAKKYKKQFNKHKDIIVLNINDVIKDFK